MQVWTRGSLFPTHALWSERGVGVAWRERHREARGRGFLGARCKGPRVQGSSAVPALAQGVGVQGPGPAQGLVYF